MDAPERGALTLVRLIGGLLIVLAILELGLYWARCAFAKPPAPVELFPCLLRTIPALLGFVVLIKARAIAKWISNSLDL